MEIEHFFLYINRCYFLQIIIVILYKTLEISIFCKFIFAIGTQANDENHA